MAAVGHGGHGHGKRLLLSSFPRPRHPLSVSRPAITLIDHFKYMGLNIFYVFLSISVIIPIDAQIILSLADWGYFDKTFSLIASLLSGNTRYGSFILQI